MDKIRGELLFGPKGHIGFRILTKGPDVAGHLLVSITNNVTRRKLLAISSQHIVINCIEMKTVAYVLHDQSDHYFMSVQ